MTFQQIANVQDGLLDSTLKVSVRGEALMATTASSPNRTAAIQELNRSQQRVVLETSELLRNGKVVFSECESGSIRSRIIAHMAAHAIELHRAGILRPANVAEAVNRCEPSVRSHLEAVAQVHAQRTLQSGAHCAVLVATDSVERVGRLCQEWQTARGVVDPTGSVTACVVLEREQFVSQSALVELISKIDGGVKSIESWLANGMPAGLTASTAAVKRQCSEAVGLMDDLLHLAEPIGVDLKGAALTEFSPAPEQETYARLLKKAFESDIVFTTHVMLCMDAMTLSEPNCVAMLPQPTAVFVDEAHMLESTKAQMASRSISFPDLLFMLRTADWKLVRKASVAAGLVSLVVKAERALLRLSPTTTLQASQRPDAAARHAWDKIAEVSGVIAVKLEQILVAGKAGSTSKSPLVLAREFAYLERCVQALNMLRDGSPGFLDISPTRRNLTLTVGCPSVSHFLAARWAVSPCCMLLSGTLFRPGHGQSAVAKEMGVSDFRAAMGGPMSLSWVTSIPVLHQPGGDDFRRFVPPPAGKSSEQSQANWAKEVAREVARVAASAMGGTLVLMAGYQRLETVTAALQPHHDDLGERLILQSRSLPVSSCAARFRAMGAEGKRPIWIATGTAWSAIDLSDREIPDDRAHEDILLTDLVIPALPFGMERGIAHRIRKQTAGFSAEVAETLRKTRIGVARLMTRDGVKDRHIWLLDGRLIDPAAAKYTADIRRWLFRYINRKDLIQGN